MVLDPASAVAPRDDGLVRVLSAQHTNAMLELAEATNPGPFDRRTPELGVFVGVFQDARLVGMAGERFRLPGFVELSAIAVHPMARGKGLATTMIRRLSSLASARGETPFLHVFPNNPAVELYESLGFRTRAELWILWRRPNR